MRTIEQMTEAIGDTPLVRLDVTPDHADVWVKVEGGNPTGSYKDRMALSTIEQPERRRARHLLHESVREPRSAQWLRDHGPRTARAASRRHRCLLWRRRTAGMLMGVATEFRAIPQDVSRQTARRLASTAGIFAGWSSGLNVSAALEIATVLGSGHTVVTVACDSGLKYLDGALFA